VRDQSVAQGKAELVSFERFNCCEGDDLCHANSSTRARTRFVRRDSEGKFKESDDAGRSLAQDQKRDSNNEPKKGEGDKGDR
jgi:hypothetical protein